MRGIIYFLFLGTLFMACTKDAYKGEKPNSELGVPANFEWKTLERKTVTLTETSSVYFEKENQTGKTERLFLGDGLAPGEYDFAVSNLGGKLVTEPIEGLGRSVSRANDNSTAYFPYKGGWATMIFEDVFPATGDLDMNDIVFDFQIIYELDNSGGGARGRVHAIDIKVQPRAMGGNAYPTIGLAANLVTSNEVTVKKITQISPGGDLFSITNGIEDGIESSTVIPLCNNLYDCFGKGQKGIINTYKKIGDIEADPFTVTIEFQNKGGDGLPLYKDMNVAGDNYLLDLFIVLGERGREIHRKGCPPTDKFDKGYLSDKSNNNNFSSRKDNYVWALIIGNTFKYPIESKAIHEAYPDFSDWVQGKFTGDWYLNQKGDYLY